MPAYELGLDSRSALLWDIKQRRAVIPYGRFGRTCRSHRQRSRSTRGIIDVKVRGLPQQAEVAQGVPGRLRPRIFLTFGTTRVVGRQPYAPAGFTPGEIPGTHF